MKLLLQRICLPLKEFTLEVDVEIQGQVTAIFGPSGAGKTSLLDLVAGLRNPKCALIQLNDRVLTNTARGLNVSARSREIGYLPQDLALFPHLSVRGNLLFGYKAASNSLFRFEHVIDVMDVQSLLPRGVTEHRQMKLVPDAAQAGNDLRLDRCHFTDFWTPLAADGHSRRVERLKLGEKPQFSDDLR